MIMTMQPVLFHLAFPVSNIAEAKAYYVEGLGCIAGRENANSLILNLCGHQIVAHVSREPLTPQKGIYPRHFGLIFTAESDWNALLDRATQKGLKFHQSARYRFTGTPLEHRTFFLEDPFLNLMEFKYYAHFSAVFGEVEYTEIGDAASVAH